MILETLANIPAGQLTAFVAGGLVLNFAPGQDVFFASACGIQGGPRAGAWAGFGVGLGVLMHVALATVGLGAIVAAHPEALRAIKYAGAAYLLWLAWKMWRAAAEPLSMEAPAADARSAAGLVWQGIATQLANPKPAVFFGTIFLTFLPPQAPLWGYGAILALIFVNDAGWNVIVARIFSLERTRRGYMSLKSVIDRIFGGLLALMGLKLAAT